MMKISGWTIGALSFVALGAAGCASDPPKAQGASTSTKTFAILAQNPSSGGSLVTYEVDDPTKPPVGMSSVPVSAPVAIAVSPNKKFLLVADAGSATQTVKSYAIGLNASLTLSAGSNGPETASSVSIDPSGTYVYATFPTSKRAYSFAFDPTVGDMAVLPTAPTGVATGSGPSATAVDKATQYLYVADSGSNTIHGYTIGTAGALTAISGSPFAPTGGASGITSVKVDPSGKFLYTADYTSGTVSAYTIGTGGALSQVGSPVAAGTGTRALVFNSTGTYLYAVNELAGTVSQYSLDATSGALTSLGAAVSFESSVAVGTASIAMHPSDLALFVTGESSGKLYVIGATFGSGTLTSSTAIPMTGAPTDIKFVQLTQ